MVVRCNVNIDVDGKKSIGHKRKTITDEDGGHQQSEVLAVKKCEDGNGRLGFTIGTFGNGN